MSAEIFRIGRVGLVSAWLGLCVGLWGLAGAAWGESQPPGESERFAGWQGMRVVMQEGSPSRLRAGDLNGDGRDELVVVNTRMSRLELYRWVGLSGRAEGEGAFEFDADDVNELPMALELERHEVVLEQLPRDVLIRDLDGDGLAELVVLVSSPSRVLIYEQEEASQGDRPGRWRWRERERFDLLPGEYSGGDRLMLFRALGASGELLVSFDQGIQRLGLSSGDRPRWVEPREDGGRADWWLLDLDGDGELDVVERRRDARRSVRWYRAAGDRLLPPQVIYEQSVDTGVGLPGGAEGDELLLLGGVQRGMLRRYGLDVGDETVFGKRDVLPLPGGERAVWCSMVLDGRSVLVAADTAQPRLMVYELTRWGWEADEPFPIMANVVAMASPAGSPGTLLLWVRDAATLHVSMWESGRLTYPKPLDVWEGSGERRVLGLGRAGSRVWWVVREGSDLELCVWSEGDESAIERTRFAGVGGTAQQATWLGGERLLVMDQYARTSRLVWMVEGEAESVEPAHVRSTKGEEYRLVEVDGQLRLGRMAEGVLQWLDEQLHADDQVMLPDGGRLAGFTAISEDEAWALEQGGEWIHRLRGDESGVLRSVERISLPGGWSVTDDAVLGMVLQTQLGVTRLARGSARELSLRESIDGRAGRPSGVREATIHRTFVTDVTGDGRLEVVLSDDRRNQLTVLERQGDSLEPVLSWRVFDDRQYPYGYVMRDSTTSEPRSVVGLDMDGDGEQDLAMLCHDRLILYVGREAR